MITYEEHKDRQEKIENLLETLCGINTIKNKRLITKLYFETAHILILEEQFKQIAKNILKYA